MATADDGLSAGSRPRDAILIDVAAAASLGELAVTVECTALARNEVAALVLGGSGGAHGTVGGLAAVAATKGGDVGRNTLCSLVK